MTEERTRLVAEAEGLGIRVHHRMMDETIQTLIDEAKARTDDGQPIVEASEPESAATESVTVAEPVEPHVAEPAAAPAPVVAPEPVTKSVETPEPVAEPKKSEATPSPSVKVPKDVMFFWKGGRNMTFSVQIGTHKDGDKVFRDMQSYRTKNSTLVLDEVADAPAIKKLRGHTDNEASGGALFTEVKERRATEGSAGAELTKLMDLPHKTLAQMVGGTVQDFRKTKGDLIAELLKK